MTAPSMTIFDLPLTARRSANSLQIGLYFIAYYIAGKKSIFLIFAFPALVIGVMIEVWIGLNDG